MQKLLKILEQKCSDFVRHVTLINQSAWCYTLLTSLFHVLGYSKENLKNSLSLPFCPLSFPFPRLHLPSPPSPPFHLPAPLLFLFIPARESGRALYAPLAGCGANPKSILVHFSLKSEIGWHQF